MAELVFQISWRDKLSLVTGCTHHAGADRHAGTIHGLTSWSLDNRRLNDLIGRRLNCPPREIVANNGMPLRILLHSAVCHFGSAILESIGAANVGIGPQLVAPG